MNKEFRIFSLVGFILLASLPVSSQSLDLSALGNIIGIADDQCHAVAFGPNGEIFLGGYFGAIADFDPDTSSYSLTAGSLRTGYLASYDAQGNFRWAIPFSSSSNTEVADVKVDSSGNSIVTGHFNGTVDFDPGPGSTPLTSLGGSAAGPDIFIAKYDLNGNLLWARQVEGTGGDFGEGIALKANGDIFLTGSFEETADFDVGSSTFSLTSNGASDIFLLKLTGTGEFVWAIEMGGSATDVGREIVWSPAGMVYISGQFSGIADFDPGPVSENLQSAGNRDLYLAGYDDDGALQFAFGMGSPDYESVTGMDLSPNDGLVISGDYLSGFDLDPGPGTFLLGEAGNGDGFFAQYDFQGEFIQAAVIGNGFGDGVRDIAMDETGQILVTGIFEGSLDMDPSGDDLILTATTQDMYIAKYDHGLKPRWAYALPGDGTERDSRIMLNDDGQILLAGQTERKTDFDPGPGEDTLDWNGSENPFFAVYDQCQHHQDITQTICQGTTYQLGSHTLDSTGIYTEAFDLGNGCDSVLTLDLTVTPVDISVNTTGASLTANATNASFQWYECNTDLLIAGATSATFADTLGSFYVVVTQNGCADTSNCFILSITNQDEFLQSSQLNIWPNPASSELFLQFDHPTRIQELSLWNFQGQNLVQFPYFGTYERLRLNLPKLPPGLYLLTLQDSEGDIDQARFWVK